MGKRTNWQAVVERDRREKARQAKRAMKDAKRRARRKGAEPAAAGLETSAAAPCAAEAVEEDSGGR